MSEPISLSRFIATIDDVRYFCHPRMVARCQALATENEDLREAAHAALNLLSSFSTLASNPQVIAVVQALESALDPEQDGDDEEDE